ncbi:hypothetical protein D3C73_1553810 [compost metagenome]
MSPMNSLRSLGNASFVWTSVSTTALESFSYEPPQSPMIRLSSSLLSGFAASSSMSCFISMPFS